MIDDAATAWCAGLYEGEGTVIYGASHRGPLRVKISSTDRDVLDLMRERSGVGAVYGPYEPNGFGLKPFHEWVVNGRVAVEFLAAIRPWLGARRAARVDEKVALWRERPRQHRMNPETRAAVRARRRDGATLREIAGEFGVSFAYVGHICSGHSHPEEFAADPC